MGLSSYLSMIENIERRGDSAEMSHFNKNTFYCKGYKT